MIIGSLITTLSPGDIPVVTVIYNSDGQAVWAGRLITGGPPKPSANVFSNWCSVHVALSKWSFFRPDLYTTPRAQEIYIIIEEGMAFVTKLKICNIIFFYIIP